MKNKINCKKRVNPNQQSSMFLLTIFSIAMGFLECAVVIYLRRIYYPEGFKFPLHPMDYRLVSIEFIREVATIVMLACIAMMSGKSKMQGFAWFLYCFALWDISYYAFLKIFLDWPDSLLTWDILFLIPVPWTGPVISPLLVAFGLFLFSLIIIHRSRHLSSFAPSLIEWILLISGGVVMVLAWCWDYARYMFENHPGKNIWTLAEKDMLFEEISHYIPSSFNWPLFTIGLLCSSLGFLGYYFRTKTQLPP